jgi:hypothetical protein
MALRGAARRTSDRQVAGQLHDSATENARRYRRDNLKSRRAEDDQNATTPALTPLDIAIVGMACV